MNVRALIFSIMSFALFSAPAFAQERPAGPPSATVRIKQIQVALIGSGALGGGTLNFGGRSYAISVGGLGIGGIGASSLTATGSVYGLISKSDFAGPYVQLRQGWALGDKGRGRLWLRNDKGVIMRLDTRRKGLQLALGADGVLISFK